MKLLQEAEIKNKKVFLRVDLNVPMERRALPLPINESSQNHEITNFEYKIVDDNRIVAVLPTIKHILSHGGRIIIGAHLGRPEGQNKAEFSLFPVANRLAELLELKVNFVEPAAIYKLNDNLSLLENLRFDPREEANDPEFAEMLAGKTRNESGELGIYVNDAFAVSHRANASVEAITKFLPSYAGLLLQKEIENLSKLRENPEPPFIVVIGGIKVNDKASVITELAQKADKIMLGGGVANTFLKARGDNISSSAYDEEMIGKCKEMLDKYSDKLVLQSDSVREIDEDGSFKILDIGSRTRTEFANAIRGAKTVFWNGSLGYSEDERYQGGMMSVAHAMSEVDGFTVIAGGDTVGFVRSERLGEHISFLSTGGGAALEFLAGEKLPGIEALEK
ncbi:phosphoglycerate kinase [Candidatus Berkelbacteria bacterium CG10_big_fil_rev_8_21_14_0_10_43_13]|uniref:Phosphoglycerate kinase n=1 Tax=Candidatus Berkelbacteria bacterium CG10_big_fil_rev_8_21_14_0_10_43_13 TaxID=1974514 RepID=A0A2H0W9B7_9BACT|nr:MAG: phosphoglycerate kinase [Candidatus Berkelbacteria bacterium CG10_big_fil_rev_8_21_14_0_10_43_13]